jgi:nucleotide-binding universal stress UspA family protein
MLTIEMTAEIAYDRILLATDFSPAADVAATYAVGLACRFSSTLELVHVTDRRATVASVDVAVRLAHDAVKRSAEERLQRMAARISRVKVTKKIIEGLLPALHILEAALEARSELIVMGTSSKPGFGKRVLGSTAEEIIRRAVCPVLTVGPHVTKPAKLPITFQNIIYATDLSPHAAKAAPYAYSFAKGSGANLYLCHVIEDTDMLTPSTLAASSASFRNLVPKHAYDWCNPHCVTEKGNAAVAILKLAKRVNANLIVLAARQSSFWLTYIDTGLTPALLAGAWCPVFTVR